MSPSCKAARWRACSFGDSKKTPLSWASQGPPHRRRVGLFRCLCRTCSSRLLWLENDRGHSSQENGLHSSGFKNLFSCLAIVAESPGDELSNTVLQPSSHLGHLIMVRSVTRFLNTPLLFHEVFNQDRDPLHLKGIRSRLGERGSSTTARRQMPLGCLYASSNAVV